MKHTPEPWELPEGPLTIETLKIFDGEEWIIFPPSGELGPIAQVRGAENAKRIASCINACAGIENPAGLSVALKVLHDMSTGAVPRSDMRALATHALNALRAASADGENA